MEKLKYELDPHNRLTVRSGVLRGTRKVLDGQFKVSAGNTLAYHVKAPFPDGLNAPHQVKLKGNWSLSKDHQLCLTLDKWKRQTFGDQLTLQGEILDVHKNSLLFAVSSKTKDSTPAIYTLELAGAWQADKHNRLIFKVNKENGRFDTLTFNGAWQIDKNYRITYTYNKRQLTRKSKQTRTLVFDGYWDIKDKVRLLYVLDIGSGSQFDFKTGMGVFKDKYIKYELGIGFSRKSKPLKRTITFSGSWKLNKTSGLVFELSPENGKIQEIVFGAQAKLTDNTTVSFKLRNILNKELSATLELSQEIFKGAGQSFLRLLKSKQESAIIAGLGWRW